MSDILFAFILSILSANPTLDYQVDMNSTENKYGEKYLFEEIFSEFSTTTFNNPTTQKNNIIRWGRTIMFDEIIYKDYAYYRAYNKNHLLEKEKNNLIKQLDDLLEICVEKTNYPKRMYLTNNYKKNIRKGSDIVDQRMRDYYTSTQYKVRTKLRYTYKFYTYEDIVSIKNDLNYLLRKPLQYIKFRKRIKTPDLYEKCRFYASGYPYGHPFHADSIRDLENINEVKKIAEEVYLLAYKHHMVSQIMSTDSNYASVPFFLIQKYITEGKYFEKENQQDFVKADRELIRFLFNYLDSLTVTGKL